MANEITWDSVTGLTFNVYRFKTDDNVFLANPATNEVWGTGGRTAADYAIVMSESGASGHYSVDFNDGGAIAAGVYRFVIALQAGVNPANADVKVAKGEIDWDGTAEITPSVIDTVVDTIAVDVAGLDGAAMHGTDGAITSLDPITTDKDSYKATSVTVSDKTGFSLSTAGILAIWHQALTSITTVGSVGKKLKDWVVGQITGTDDIDFSATQKVSLNAATPDLSAITSDKDSYKATGFATASNITTAHNTTDGKIDAVQGDVTVIVGDVAGLDGVAMRGTDGANTVIPDAAGAAATLHGVTDGKIDALNNITVADILAGVVEGTITLQQSLRGLMSTNFGKASGGDTTSIKFRDLADTKNRVTETVDENGNRTSITLDLT